VEPFNFDKLPEVIRLLYEKVERLEEILIKLQPAKAEEDQLLTVKEAAELLKVTVASLYAKVSRKEIPVHKPGRILYFYKEDLLQWVRDSKRKTMAELQKEAQIGRYQRRGTH